MDGEGKGEEGKEIDDGRGEGNGCIYLGYPWRRGREGVEADVDVLCCCIPFVFFWVMGIKSVSVHHLIHSP